MAVRVGVDPGLRLLLLFGPIKLFLKQTPDQFVKFL